MHRTSYTSQTQLEHPSPQHSDCSGVLGGSGSVRGSLACGNLYVTDGKIIFDQASQVICYKVERSIRAVIPTSRVTRH